MPLQPPVTRIYAVQQHLWRNHYRRH